MAHFIVRHERTSVSTLVLRAVLVAAVLAAWVLAVGNSGSLAEAVLVTVLVGVTVSYALLGTPELRNYLNGLPQWAAEMFCEASLSIVEGGLLWASYVLVGEWVADLAVLGIALTGVTVGRFAPWSYETKARWFALVGLVSCFGNIALTLTDPVELAAKVVFVTIPVFALGANLIAAYALAHRVGPGADLVGHVAEQRTRVHAEQQWEALLAARRRRRQRNIAKKRVVRRALGL